MGAGIAIDPQIGADDKASSVRPTMFGSCDILYVLNRRDDA